MDAGMRITFWGLGINVALALLKFGMGLATGSMALLADGVHTTSDIATDLVVLGGLRLARRPADRSHTYGHGKFETVATTVLALALLGAGGWIAWEAALALLQGGMSVPGPIVAGVAALSVLSKEWLFRTTVRVARRLRSSSLAANAWHHRSDAWSSVAVVIGGVAAAFGVHQADQIAALAVALLIGWVSVGILRRALYELTEGALGEVEQARVAQAIAGVAGVESWHKLRTRGAGRHVFVDVHIQVAPELSVEHAHAIASQVERAIEEALGCQVSATVHVEPLAPRE